MAVIRFRSDPIRQKFFGRRKGARLPRLMPRREVIEHDLGEAILMGLDIDPHLQFRQHDLPCRRKTLLKGVQIVPV